MTATLRAVIGFPLTFRVELTFDGEEQDLTDSEVWAALRDHRTGQDLGRVCGVLDESVPPMYADFAWTAEQTASWPAPAGHERSRTGVGDIVVEKADGTPLVSDKITVEIHESIAGAEGCP